jgi:hypothetical protein
VRIVGAAGALILSVALHGIAAGQTTGRIEGRVVDAATGEPLVGGQVRIGDTALGNVTRGDGSFFIEAVPVGIQFVHTEYLGYGGQDREAQVSGGKTTRLEFALDGAAIDTPAIVATITYEPWIPSVQVPIRPLVHRLAEPVAAPPPAARCDVEAVLHGSYILDGRWQLHTTVGDLRCWSDEDPADVAPCERRSPAPPPDLAQAR